MSVFNQWEGSKKIFQELREEKKERNRNDSNFVFESNGRRKDW